jgi:HlyD family secretion protein
MVTNVTTEKDKQQLNERLRSLKIEREPEHAPGPQMRVPKGLLLALSAVVALAAVGYFYVFSPAKAVSAAEVKVETGPPSMGTTVLSVSGYVVPHHKIAVGGKVMGRVQWIGVEKGDRVKQGQTLVRLEDVEYVAQVNQARGNLAAAQARLDALKVGSRPEEKLRDQASVRQAEANLKNAEFDYERTERLYRNGVTSKADLDRATAARDTARAVLASIRQTSTMTDIGPRVEDIRAGEALVKQLKGALDYAQTQLDATQIKAPVSGTVLQREVELGEMVSPNSFGENGAKTSVVSLADLNDLQIELDISQADFARLKMGQKAEIIPDAYPNLRYKGFISEIAPEANRAKSTVQVKVKVENPDEQLRPEMNARANFLSDEPPRQGAAPSNRVLVPKSAVVHKGDGDFVFIVKGDRVEQRVIRRGDESGDSYLVLEGLSGGENVVTTEAESLHDGSRVKINGR